MRKSIIGWLVLLLCVLGLCSCASAGVKVTGGMAVYSKTNGSFLRTSDGKMDSLKKNEYISFMVEVKNTGKKEQKYKNVYFRVDDGNKLTLSNFSLKGGKKKKCHIYNTNMKNLAPGLHRVKFYINNKCVYSGKFYLTRAWKSLMKYPTAKQKKSVRGKGRSPYIVYYPQFNGVEGITEYSIDFWIDDMDKGTYFSTLSGHMDISALENKYSSVTNDYGPGSFYCGVQCWEDGRTAVIMSVWDCICKDQNGKEKIICANQIYPKFKKGVSKLTGEGRFQQFLQEYRLKTKHPYRVLMQLSTNQKNGNTTLAMWIGDLSSNKWKRLVEWDLGYKSRYIKTYPLAGFLENYVTEYSGSVRNVSFSNIQGRNYRNNKWVAAKSVRFTVNNSMGSHKYLGSYNFGSDDSTFWIITSGVSNLCRSPKSGTVFSVKHSRTGNPY